MNGELQCYPWVGVHKTSNKITVIFTSKDHCIVLDTYVKSDIHRDMDLKEKWYKEAPEGTQIPIINGFPKLMKSNSDGAIVLFITNTVCIIINSKQNYSNNVLKDDWIACDHQHLREFHWEPYHE